MENEITITCDVLEELMSQNIISVIWIQGGDEVTRNHRILLVLCMKSLMISKTKCKH